MAEVRFSVPGIPYGKQRPKFSTAGNFVRTYTPKKTLEYENMVRLCYQQAAKGYVFPDDAVLDVRIIAYHEIPKSASKKKHAEMANGKIRPARKPDFDNCAKIICDSLNGIAYRDDVAIVDAQVRKFYSERPRVDVIIRQIGGE